MLVLVFERLEGLLLRVATSLVPAWIAAVCPCSVTGDVGSDGAGAASLCVGRS